MTIIYSTNTLVSKNEGSGKHPKKCQFYISSETRDRLMKDGMSGFTAVDSFVILVIGVISAGARLWTISYPETVTFDEVHFGNFTSWYVRNEFHFDIHPPLGKMIMAAISKAAGYKGDIASFSSIGSDYRMNETQYVMIRMIPAIFASMCAPLLYSSARCLDISVLPSVLGALMVALDSSMIVESKFILSDGMLHFFSALHYFTFCLFLREQTYTMAIISGITLGAAGACKFTALGLIAVDGVTQVVWILTTCPDILDIMVRAICILTPAAIVTLFAWCWHFAANPYAGYHSSYMAKEDSHTLIDLAKVNTTYWGNRVSRSPFPQRLANWLIVMNRINMRSKIPHPWESRPENWPFLRDKYVLFYSRTGRRVNCFGLPASYWFSTASVFLAIPAMMYHRKLCWQSILCLWSWLVSYVPFLGIPRTMFHYHYIIPLMWACLNTSAVLDFAITGKKAKHLVTTLLIILTVLCYEFFSPHIYGYSCPNCDRARQWLSAWTKGPPKPLSMFGKELFNTTEIRTVMPL